MSVCARPGCGTSLARNRAGSVWCSNACRMAAQRAQDRAQNAHGKLTQAERVLVVLSGRLNRGITQVDFQLPNVIDGGPPITRLAARIDELRQQGHTIVSGERRQRCVVYRLQTSASPGSVPAPLSPPAAAGPGEALVACSEPRACEEAEAPADDGSLRLFVPAAVDHYREDAA